MDKITIMTGSEKAELERKARSRKAFKEMLASGEYRPNVQRNRKRKDNRDKGLKRLRDARKGAY